MKILLKNVQASLSLNNRTNAAMTAFLKGCAIGVKLEGAKLPRITALDSNLILVFSNALKST